MATPKDRPGRLDIVARARSENAPWLSALSRCRREVGHAGRAGLAGIVWLFFEACQYLERSREPGRRLARPMEFSRTRNPSRPKRASETQGKRARFKENSDQQSSDPRVGKGVKLIGTKVQINLRNCSLELILHGTQVERGKFSTPFRLLETNTRVDE